MHLAIFTSEFPSKAHTYFQWDLRALLESGFEISIFPVRSIDSSQWHYLNHILDKNYLDRIKVRYIKPRFPLLDFTHPNRNLFSERASLIKKITSSALKFGIVPLIKTGIVISQALHLVSEIGKEYDHILAYWGNYASTYAYLFHKWGGLSVPFSMILHAGTDLYRNQVFLDQKLLYSDNIFTVCNFNRKFVQELYPDIYDELAPKLSIHQLGLDLTAFPFELKKREQRKLIAVGRLDNKKGYDYLLRSVSELHSKGVILKLEIIGNGPEENFLKRLSHQLGISEIVTFSGWLSLDEVKARMQSATLLVHPSPCIGDAVPTVIKEAIASGLPVIGTNISGIPELLDYGRCGILIPPADISALTSAIKRLLENDQERSRIARLARLHAEANYDLNHTSKYLVEKIQNSSRINRL